MAKIDEYKHPKWQAMRLKALEAKGFTCEGCYDSEKTLHVHHKEYPKGKIWECSLDDLEVLCEDCHQNTERLVSYMRRNGTDLRKCFDVAFFGQLEDLFNAIRKSTRGFDDKREDFAFKFVYNAYNEFYNATEEDV